MEKVNPIRESLRKAVYRVAPRTALDAYLRLKMLRDARRLVTLRDHNGEPGDWIDDLMGSHFFRPMQKRSEILPLIDLVRVFSPATVCEIGAARGGTAFLFAHAAAPNATLISVDLTFHRMRRDAVSRFARRGQKVICIEGDARSNDTFDAVRKILQGRPLDLLYLDGDHAYESVVADFRLYSPLVRRGGYIVLHDIVPDFRTRYGKVTPSDTGGVPQFWNELKSAHASVQEIIEDHEQDGYGLGILRWDGPRTIDK